MSSICSFVAIAAAIAASPPVAVQPIQAVESAPHLTEAQAPATILLPALTGVQLAVLEELTSKTIATGAPVRMALSYPLYIHGQLGLPVGTPVEGVVIHAAKGGFGGKPGELVLAAKRIMLTDGSSIPLRSFKLVPQKGKDNQALAMGMVVAGGAIGGVAAMFITGGSARVAPGAYGTAKTSADTALASSNLSTLPAIPVLVLPASSPSAGAPAVPASAVSDSSGHKGN